MRQLQNVDINSLLRYVIDTSLISSNAEYILHKSTCRFEVLSSFEYKIILSEDDTTEL